MYNPQDAANMVTGGISHAAGSIGETLNKEKEDNTPLPPHVQKFYQMALEGKMDPRQAALRAKLVTAGHTHVDIEDPAVAPQGLGTPASMPPPLQAPTLGPPTFQQQYAPDSMGPGLGASQVAAMQTRPATTPGASIGGGASINSGPGLGAPAEKPWTRKDAADLLPLIPHLQRQDNYANQMAMLQYKQAEMDARQKENLGVKKTEGDANRGSREKNTSTMAGAGITRSNIAAKQSDTNSQRTFTAAEDRISSLEKYRTSKGATHTIDGAKAIVKTFDDANRELNAAVSSLGALAQDPAALQQIKQLQKRLVDSKPMYDEAIKKLAAFNGESGSSTSASMKTPSKFVNGQVYTSPKTGKRGRWSDNANGFVPVE